MSDVVISVEGIGKKFSKSLKRGMIYGGYDIARGFLGLAPATEELRAGEFWSLQDVSFELRRGECLGLIGPNGAGKSTLLKILNGIVAPSRGCVTLRGRVGALIEIGAGFHPLLTGRENIYVNGAILGLKKKEIDRKFDAMVDFADLAEFIDSPVKHYSSGMYVRLGFAIAAQMEPDILLIDEILAVGDAGFRSKCYNAISHMSERTAIVLVSHSMPSISRMATQTMVLNRGGIVQMGPTAESIARYHRLFVEQISPSRQGTGTAQILSLRFLDDCGKAVTTLRYGSPLTAEICIHSEVSIQDACIDLVFVNVADEVVAECNNRVARRRIDLEKQTDVTVSACIREFTLNAGIYKISALIQSANMMTHYDWLKDFATLEIVADQVGVAGQQFRADWSISPASLDASA
jgi:lipopolysaccharide transport system ATP-binding protein